MCMCQNAKLVVGEGFQCYKCQSCGAEWDFVDTTVKSPLIEENAHAITRHQKTMARIRDIVAHTCDGPLTTFVHVVRVLNMVEAFDITAEEGANYLHEAGLLNNENNEIPSSEY